MFADRLCRKTNYSSVCFLSGETVSIYSRLYLIQTVVRLSILTRLNLV